jgi:hypothetical protein
LILRELEIRKLEVFKKKQSSCWLNEIHKILLKMKKIIALEKAWFVFLLQWVFIWIRMLSMLPGHTDWHVNKDQDFHFFMNFTMCLWDKCLIVSYKETHLVNLFLEEETDVKMER